MDVAMKDCREERKLAGCWWLTVTVTEAVAMAEAVIMVMAESTAMADPLFCIV